MVKNNLEHAVYISADSDGVNPKDIERLNAAWASGDYRIQFELYIGGYENPTIEISARRYGKYEGVDITRQWRAVCEELVQGNIPDWLIEKALKNN